MDVVLATLAHLALFIDQMRLIRVGGCLKHSKLDKGAKNPILLSQLRHLTDLIIRHYHQLLLHGKAGVVLSIINRRYRSAI